jgi:type II secretory pathway pseudopilin PulG
MMNPNTKFGRTLGRAVGFTVTELLVVIIIIVIGATLLLPATSRIIESNNYSSAVNLVSTTLANARAQAIRSGLPTGVVFLFDTQTEVCTMQVVELRSRQGGVLTQFAASDPRHAYAQVFRPAAGTAPVELPVGFTVAGLSFSTAPGSGDGSLIDRRTSHWYAGEIYQDSFGNEVIPWIFPRDDVYHFIERTSPPLTREEFWDLDGISESDATDAVRHAATFMIRFSESGSVVTTSGGGGIATPNAYLEFVDGPLDRREDFDPDSPPEPADRADRFDPETGLGVNLTGSAVNFEPNPEVLLRSADQLAVVDLIGMRRELGIETPWFVRPERAGSLPMPGPNGPTDDGWYAIADDDEASRISLWIDFNAELISFNRYTGEVLRKANP